MQDNDCDDAIDCADPDCTDVVPCRPARKDPTSIRFAQNGLDRFRSHATLDIPPVDLIAVRVGVLLTNSKGALYRAELPPGSLVPRAGGRIFEFRDPAARTGEGNPFGLYRLKLKQHRDGAGYTIRSESFADLSAANDPMMRVQFYVGDDVFITIAAPWTSTGNGWRAPKDH
jgi:hypothetical protein